MAPESLHLVRYAKGQERCIRKDKYRMYELVEDIRQMG